MSGKKAKAARRAARAAAPPVRSNGAMASLFWASWKGGLVGLAVVAVVSASFVLIKGLEQMKAELDERGIALVSITPDSPADVKQAIGQYGIASPMIADQDRDMSAAFDTLGRGMHADTPGHAFALIEKGKVLWYRDYWLPPDRTMYVEPAKVLADLAAA